MTSPAPDTDDVDSLRFTWLSNGKIPPDALKPQDDMLAGFPTSACQVPNQKLPRFDR